MKKTTSGFTIAELIIMVTIIGILSTIVVVGLGKIQTTARDNQRSEQITLIATALEKYFEKYGEYPDCSSMTASPNTVVTTTLKGMNPEILTAPQTAKNTNSITSCINEPTANSYSYIAANGGYTLKYLEESTGMIVSKVSKHAAYIAVSDNFNRTAATLGTSTIGAKTWTALSGSWSTNGTRAVTSTADSSNPIAVIDAGYANVDTSVDVSSSGGGDSLIIRASDSNNYIKARYYHTITTVAGYCTIGAWVYQGQVYTENWSPGSTIPGYDKIGGNCLPYDEWPNFNGNGAAQTKTVVTSTKVTCDPPYVNVCYWGNSYWRSVVDTPASSTHHYFIYLDKVINGVVTNLYNNEVGSSISNIRLRAVNSTIGLYINKSTTETTTITDSFNSTATKHGIGRSTGGDVGTSGLDNYSLNQI
ncbi:MAG: type II secretion system protein [Thiobacillus sp.]